MSDDRRTARDWLLARHAVAGPELDAARARALRDTSTELPVELTTGSLLRALFCPARFAWAALAVAWLFLAVIHFTVARPAPAPSTRNVPPEAIARYVTQLHSRDSLAEINHLD